MKKFLSLVLSLCLIFSLTLPCFALSDIDESIGHSRFIGGEGPKTNGYSLDYLYYSPVKENDSVKYPLVVWLHGMGQGSKPGAQLSANNFSLWASDELQSRFKGTAGAFLLAVRSREENGQYWSNDLIPTLKATIDDFINKNADNIDLTRIYIGGYSMGGKMTLKMAACYPSMFAAAFPICPAFDPSTEQISYLKDMPVWLTVSKYDVLAGYFTYSEQIWKNLKNTTSNPENLRLSLMGTTKYPTGKKTLSNHHAWYSVTADMFTYDNEPYYNMQIVNGYGDKITLDYPNGIISWISSFTSSYNGQDIESTHAFPEKEAMTFSLINMLFPMIRSMFRIMFSRITDI